MYVVLDQMAGTFVYSKFKEKGWNILVVMALQGRKVVDG